MHDEHGVASVYAIKQYRVWKKPNIERGRGGFKYVYSSGTRRD
jgi:hypothetical protein